MDPFISFIIPIFNASNVIESCIRSIISLEEKSIEIIAIDDGSKDSDILEKILSQYPNVLYVRQENAGVSAARNKGISLAKGKYVTFLDADDYLLPERYDRIIKHIKESNTNSDVYMFGYIYKSEKIEKNMPLCLTEGIYDESGTQYVTKCLLDIRYAKRQNCHYIGGKVYQYIVSNEILQENQVWFPVGIHYAEDLCYCLKLMNSCKSLNVISEYAYVYTINSGSASHRFRKSFWEDYQLVWNEIKEIKGTDAYLHQVYVGFAKNSIDHFMMYSKVSEIRVIFKLLKSMLTDQLTTNLNVLDFTDWTIKERIENHFIKSKNYIALTQYEYIVFFIKKMKWLMRSKLHRRMDCD